MKQLEYKVSEVKLKKNMYIVWVCFVRVLEKLNKMLDLVNIGNILSIFEEMEEKIMQFEFQFQMIVELGIDSLEKKFNIFEGDNYIEVELKVMKVKIL